MASTTSAPPSMEPSNSASRSRRGLTTKAMTGFSNFPGFRATCGGLGETTSGGATRWLMEEPEEPGSQPVVCGAGLEGSAAIISPTVR